MDIKKELLDVNAFLQGHFLLSSGKHSNGYVQCAQLLQYPDKAEKILASVVNKIKDLRVDVVVGPAIGGIVVSYELARQLGVKSIFTEREDGDMTLRRGFTLNKDDRVIIAEDVITTGKSSLETIKAIESYGAEVLGIACIANRTGEENVEVYPLYSAIDLDIQTYEADDCPLCDQGEELVKPGSRKKFN